MVSTHRFEIKIDRETHVWLDKYVESEILRPRKLLEVGAHTTLSLRSVQAKVVWQYPSSPGIQTYSAAMLSAENPSNMDMMRWAGLQASIRQCEEGMFDD